MKTEKFDGTIGNAYGNQLATEVPFAGSFEKFTTYDEVTAAKELPTNKEVLQWANAKRKAAAVSKSRTEALTAAGINPPAKDDPKVLTREFVKTLVLAGKTRDEAIDLARMSLGAKFYDAKADESDEDEGE